MAAARPRPHIPTAPLTRTLRGRAVNTPSPFALALALLALPGPANSETGVESGPAAGTALTPVRCFAAGSGGAAGREFDAAAEVGEGPGLFLFIHELTRNTAPVIRGLDQLAQEYSLLGLRTFTILLSGDRTADEARLARVNGSLRLARPIVLGLDGAEGPGNYALNRKAALTLIAAKDGAVLRSTGLTDTGPNDVPLLRSWVEGTAGRLPEAEAELRALAAEGLPREAPALHELAVDQRLQILRLTRQVNRLQERQGRMGAQRMTRPQRGPDRGQPRRPGAAERPQADPAAAEDAADRPGRPPADAELRALLGEFLRQQVTDAAVDAAYAKILAHTAGKPEFKRQIYEGFQLMLSYGDKYGTAYARGIAQQHLEKHADDLPDN